MALYPRYIAPAIKAALADTPVVCLLGPRQAGKTTLARQLEPERAYFSFDDHRLLEAAQLDPIGFVQLLPDRVILDEVQRVPELPPAIKTAVDHRRDPGRFLLTGSTNLLLLGLVLLLAQPWAVAKSPELYGQEYVRLGQSWEDGSPRSLPAAREEYSDADESAFLEQIQIQELSDGPYSNALAEPLSSLGRYYRDQGKYDEALGLYQRALHLVRVNDGLYSERQIPLVRELLDTYRLAGDMLALDKRYEYFFRLYGNGQPPYTQLRLRASLEYLRWQREAFLLKLDGETKNRLLDMYELNKRILESAAQSTAVGQDWYRQLVLSQIRNLYLLQSEIELPDETYIFLPSRAIQSNQEPDLDFKQRRLEDIQRTSAARGRSLLQELIDRIASTGGEAADLASIHLELGDWQQWNENSRGAHQEYARVVQILEDAGDTQMLEQWLGSPAELPANGDFWQPVTIAKDGRRVVLLAEYDVSARGKVKNIQVSAAKPEDRVFTNRLRRKLLATRFRPRFATGEAEAVERVSRKYELIVD